VHITDICYIKNPACTITGKTKNNFFTGGFNMIKSKYQTTRVLGDNFLKDTGNEYRVVTQRPYKDKKNKLPDGILLTLQITKDLNQYANGEDDMTLGTFDAYVLCGTHDKGLKKGDLISLHDFKEDVSYYIDYNYILRFGDVKKLTKSGTMPNLD